jgi:hypothetical protein
MLLWYLKSYHHLELIPLVNLMLVDPPLPWISIA